MGDDDIIRRSLKTASIHGRRFPGSSITYNTFLQATRASLTDVLSVLLAYLLSFVPFLTCTYIGMDIRLDFDHFANLVICIQICERERTNKSVHVKTLTVNEGCMASGSSEFLSVRDSPFFACLHSKVMRYCRLHWCKSLNNGVKWQGFC